MSSSICIPNMTLLACKVVEKSLTKKCYGIREGRTDGRRDGMMDRCKPVYPPPPPLFQSGGIISLVGVLLKETLVPYLVVLDKSPVYREPRI